MTSPVIRIDEEEFLLKDEGNRWTIFPIKYQDIWKHYCDHEAAFWTAAEIDLVSDLKGWANLSDNERYFIKHVLAFFAAADGIIMENLASKFCNEIKIAEARSFYAFQMMIENTHSIVYSTIIATYVKDAKEKNKLFNAVETMPVIMKKAQWALKWINSEDSFATRLVAFAIVEGIFFSGSFCAIDWARHRKLGLTGLCFSNDLISRDENLHTMFACLLYTNYIVNKLTQGEIELIFKEAVDIEKEFILRALPCTLLGMNSNMMSEYIEFVANRLIKQLGYKELYPGAVQPFSFMDARNLDNQTDFFTGRVSEYQRTVHRGPVDEESKELDFDADF